ncbi:histidine phosphatase family protein [bacterium]|nr:histidine phosphatase family protein [bacterium]
MDTNELIPIPELDGQILVHELTGQIYLSGSVISLMPAAIAVRHGETDANLRRVLHGQVDGPENQLNSQGRAQAQRAAGAIYDELASRWQPRELRELARRGRLIILTSPILRARHTAEYFHGLFQSRMDADLSLNKESLLQEMSFGRYDGSALEEIDDPVYADLVQRYRKQQDATIDWCGTGESFIDVIVRARDLIERLNAGGTKKVFVLFTHGTFISALRTALGDPTLTDETGKILFRDRIVDHAVPYWLPSSICIEPVSDIDDQGDT